MLWRKTIKWTQDHQSRRAVKPSITIMRARRGREGVLPLALVASGAIAAILIISSQDRAAAPAALLRLRFAQAPQLEYITHPTRGLQYSQGQLPFDVGSVPNSKSICDWVYCPTSSEAIQVSSWTPEEERKGAAEPKGLSDYGVTWSGWDYGTYGDVTNVYEPPDCIVKHLGARTQPPKPCAVPGRKAPEDFSASSSTQPGMYAGAPVDEIDEKFGYQLPNFDARGRRQVMVARAMAAPMQSLHTANPPPNPVQGTYALSPFTKTTYPRSMGTNQVFLGRPF